MAETPKTWPVSIGGMFRCCVEVCAHTDPEQAGGSVRCPTCHSIMLWNNAREAWVWRAEDQSANA